MQIKFGFWKKVEFQNTGLFMRFLGVSIILNDHDVTSYHVGIQKWWVEKN